MSFIDFTNCWTTDKTTAERLGFEYRAPREGPMTPAERAVVQLIRAFCEATGGYEPADKVKR